MEKASIFDMFASIEPLDKGLSGDKKYCATAKDGTKHYLRIMSTDKYGECKRQVEVLEQAARVGVPIAQVINFGICTDGVYMVHSWIDGEDLELVLPKLSETEQYKMGIKAGEMLRLLHTIPAPTDADKWETDYNCKADRNIKTYTNSDFKYDSGENFVKYINDHRYLLKNRPQSLKHNDFTIRNIMTNGDGLAMVDFDITNYGDPWEDFKRTVLNAELSPHFTTGQVDGYFGSDIPPNFFKMLALYVAVTYIHVLPWAITVNQEQFDYMTKVLKNISLWFDNMTNPVPTWYVKSVVLNE